MRTESVRWPLSASEGYLRRVLECISPGVSGALSSARSPPFLRRFLPFIQAPPLREWALPPFWALRFFLPTTVDGSPPLLPLHAPTGGAADQAADGEVRGSEATLRAKRLVRDRRFGLAPSTPVPLGRSSLLALARRGLHSLGSAVPARLRGVTLNCGRGSGATSHSLQLVVGTAAQTLVPSGRP